MDYCPHCGKSVEDNQAFCAYCGAGLDSQQAETDCVSETPIAHASADVESAIEAESSDASELATEKDQSKKRKRNIAIGICAGVIVAIAIALFVYLTAKPDLPEEQILADVDAAMVSTDGLSNSQWASNDGYSETARSVDGIESTGSDAQRVNVVLTYENQSFRVERHYIATYVLVQDEWSPHEFYEESRTVVPISGLADEEIMAQTAKIASLLDEKDYEDPEGEDITFSEVYGNGATYSILENNSSADGGTATIQAVAVRGMRQYTGTITVGFEWSGEDWSISTCDLDGNAFTSSLDGLIGEYVGVFDHVEGINGSKRNCLGGRKNPLTITVKSCDEIGETITADLKFTVHNHLDPDNAVESSAGDSVYTATNVIIPIGSNPGEILYVDGANGVAEITVYMNLDDDSSIARVHIEDAYWPGGKWDTFDDYYTVDFSRK